MKNNSETFSYTYSARQQDELNKIRKKYMPKEDDKMEQIRRLDSGVTQKGSVTALIVGIISTLVLGVGMCCCMVWADSLFVPGIIIGIIGMAGVALAYPLYTHIIKRERERIAPEIIRLTDELMK